MNIYHADIQIAAARYLGWMPDYIAVTDDDITVSGWALSIWNEPAQLRFLINGADFDQVDRTLASPDLLAPFAHIPHAVNSRFFCRHRRDGRQDLFADGFIRLNVTGPFGEHRLSYRTAWYLADPAREPDMPSPAQIERVIGTGNLQIFRLGGATIAKHVEQLLLERFDRSIGSFEAILDWGCGAGRLSRYLSLLSPSVTGIDIDADNVACCDRTLPGARFVHIDLMPPTPFADGAFDLVIGLSVLTHLDEPVQDAWLAELRRITRPGALLLLSVQGLAQMVFFDTPPTLNLEAHRRGILDTGANDQLQAVLDHPSYYRNVMHSPDYIMTRWSRWFDVLDIIPAMAGTQDLVLLRRRAD
jgi:SAM-dependent methyltransferase